MNLRAAALALCVLAAVFAASCGGGESPGGNPSGGEATASVTGTSAPEGSDVPVGPADRETEDAQASEPHGGEDSPAVSEPADSTAAPSEGDTAEPPPVDTTAPPNGGEEATRDPNQGDWDPQP